MLTPEQIKEMDAIAGVQTPTPDNQIKAKAQSAANSWGGELDTAIQEGEQKARGPYSTGNLETITKGITGSLQKRGGTILSDVDKAAQQSRNLGGGVVPSTLGGLQVAGHVAGQIAGGVGDIIGETAKPFVKQFTEAMPGVAKGIASGFTHLSSMLSGVAPEAREAIKGYFEANPELARGIEDVASTASLYGGKTAEGLAPKIGETAGALTAKATPLATKAGESMSDLYKAISTKSPEQVDAYILKKFEKGVKPSIAGQGTMAKAGAYQDKAISAVKSIVENKPNLKLVDEYGEATGKLPQTLKQFADAVDQTKKQIFTKYDELQKTAGTGVATVDLKPAVDELRLIENNPTIQDLHPDIVKYVNQRATALEKRGTYSAQSAQDAITNLNNSLDAFYKRPSYETASKASVDAMIANKLRVGLDDAIEKTAGAGYQDLKNQYGALKSIEKDVVKRSLIDARKNAKGLIDFSDVLTGAEVVAGLATMNPIAITKGLAGKGIAQYYKFLNNPNTAIKQLFNVAEKGSLSDSIPLLPQTNKIVPESLPKTVP